MKNVAVMLKDIHDELGGMIDELACIRLNINYRAASRLAVETRLRMLEGRLEDENTKLNEYVVCLEQITGLIEGCENDISGKISSVKIS